MIVQASVLQALLPREATNMMDKQKAMSVLRHELETAIASRQAARSNPDAEAAHVALRRFQAARMARTHADFLASPESHAAAQFFLHDLYSSEDLTQRDANLARIVPMMERVLPVAALRTIADALALDALSEKLDAQMAEQLGENFTEADYIACYRSRTSRTDRERQLDYIESVGAALCELVRKPLVASTLAVMRGPARLANLSELQNFLERGFTAFKKMKHPEAFVATVVRRERAIMTHLYEGNDQPFSPDRFLG
jgi:hypothetical protein